MDLFREDVNIAIQWETAPDSKGKTQQGISKEWIRDITSLKQEGKMLFGWAVDSDLTEYPGAIKFSVRFYHFDEEQKLDFSLNTITASAVVNPSIDYKFDEEGKPTVNFIDSSNLIKNRLKDSITPETVAAAEVPYYIINLPVGFETTDNEVVYNSVDLIGGIDPETNEAITPAYKFTVQATSNDGGIISYQWYRTALGSEIEDTLDTTDGAGIEYVPTTDEEYSSEYPYYKYVVVDPEQPTIKAYKPVIIASELLGTEIPEEEKALLFERVSTYTAHRTGDYRVITVNRSGIAKKEAESIHVRIPGPDTESFVVVYPEGQKNSYLDGETDGIVDLIATGTTEQEGDVITYVWSDQGTGEKVQENASVALDEPVTFRVGPIAAADRPTYDKTFIITSHASRNGDDTPVATETFRVTDRAHAVTVTPKESLIKLSENEVKEIGVNTVVRVVSDEITYQWYKLTKDASDDDFLIEGATTPVIKITSSTDLAAEDVFNTGSGSYYCEVTNHANNSVAVIDSEEISVIPY